ncbi:hypothetical protein CARUB_v10006769mg [Capsella rubella]|uniref:C2 domain-containing protein n=1 Tax=Capsella rubella TaxID=81985 RepID=R0F265_9BRAS|nr:protein SRC2 [Capsella rubella]EOA15742.1 hypothetical protein CARUB_v10006769mg [Capsella rubella]
MANLNLDLKIHCATNLLNVNLLTKMDVFAKISIHGENTRKKQKVKTAVDRSAGSNPVWNQAVNFSFNKRLFLNDSLTLVMRLISRRILGNKEIGKVSIPLLELFNSITPPISGESNDEEMKLVRYLVRTRSGKESGVLTFSYRFKSDLLVTVNQNLVETPTSRTQSQVEHPPSASPEFSIEFPLLPEPPSHSRHFSAVESSDGSFITFEQFNHPYICAPLSSEGSELLALTSATPSPPLSPTRYG